MKLKRIENGHYRSADGRVTIRRVKKWVPVLQICRTRFETRWCAYVDDTALPVEKTKADAVAAAQRELDRRDGRTTQE